jgi:hypothetical protein
MLHAWFSKKQIETMKSNTLIHKDGPYKVYTTKDGTLVRASMVSDTKEHGCGFDDIKYLGQVETFVRCEN